MYGVVHIAAGLKESIRNDRISVRTEMKLNYSKKLTGVEFFYYC
uniref:Uncharacterized protein n=1 Tax=Setaria viridis TaxID=4556 RepID=A0A4U6TT89_SETVI|nr:hypothetical protein SEVIR_7G078250v2 [Setaria viridis]